MDDVIQIVIAKYQSAADAERALKKLLESRANQGVEFSDAAVVSRAENNKFKIHETQDVTGGRGATVGGILGGVLGLIAGPAGVVAGAAIGAGIGGAAASMIDTGIPHKRLQEIGASLEPQHAALVILTDAGFVPFIETLIGGKNVEILTETMNTQAAQEMGHAHDISVQGLKMGDALADGGMLSPTDAP